MNLNEPITLRFVEGKSDKTYSVQINTASGGFNVVASWGRTGSTQQTAVKNCDPIGLDEAVKLATSLLEAKAKKGYVQQGEAAVMIGAESRGRDTGYRVQLLEHVADGQTETLLADDGWGMQEKYNGERRLVIIEADGSVSGANRDGLQVALAIELVDVIRHRISVQATTVLDGEDFGTTFAPFDLLVHQGQDLRDRPYTERLALLEELIANCAEMPRPYTYRSQEQKRLIYNQLREDGFEGVVFKKLDAPYLPGKNGRDNVQFKDKFVASATCRVIGRNSNKRSIGIELIDPATGKWEAVGNCTIPPNFGIPSAGELVEVGYLYAMPNGGSLVQPTYEGVRADIHEQDCTTAQLKYKPDELHSQAA